MAKSQRARQPEKEPTRYSDLDREGRTALNASMREHGKVKNRIQGAIDIDRATAENPANKGYIRRRSGISADKLTELSSSVKNAPITVQSAAANRVAEFDRGVARANSEGRQSMRGAGWYFDHHRDLKNAASEHDFDSDRVISASASMSPLNSPDNEKAAVREMMRAHAGDHRVVPKTDQAAAVVGGQVGQPRSVRDMSGAQISGMSRAAIRQDFETPHGTDLGQIARGAVNIDKGWDVLTGRSNPQGGNPQNPQTSAKVWSYENAIRNAVPNTPEHTEYMTRVDMARRSTPETGYNALDLEGLRSSREGILDPRGHTAEDTWMNTVTMGQGMGDTPVTTHGGRGVLGKMVASHKQLGLTPKTRVETPTGMKSVMPGISGESALHAFNNHATAEAARIVSQRAGGHFELPSVAMQETAWTEARLRTGKDPSFNAERTATDKVARTVNPQQLKLF